MVLIFLLHHCIRPHYISKFLTLNILVSAVAKALDHGADFLNKYV